MLWVGLQRIIIIFPNHSYYYMLKGKLSMATLRVASTDIVREPMIGKIKWFRPKDLKVCSYVEKCVEFKNNLLKKIGWYTKMLCATDTAGVCNISK